MIKLQSTKKCSSLLQIHQRHQIISSLVLKLYLYVIIVAVVFYYHFFGINDDHSHRAAVNMGIHENFVDALQCSVTSERIY